MKVQNEVGQKFSLDRLEKNFHWASDELPISLCQEYEISRPNYSSVDRNKLCPFQDVMISVKNLLDGIGAEIKFSWS